MRDFSNDNSQRWCSPIVAVGVKAQWNRQPYIIQSGASRQEPEGVVALKVFTLRKKNVDPLGPDYDNPRASLENIEIRILY